MILTGSEIEKEVRAKQIVIDPFDSACLTTNSYDFHLGTEILTYKHHVLDTKKPNETAKIVIPETGLQLNPQKLYLGHTSETIGSKYYVPVIRGRSSTGRVGLFVHITADLIDIGSINQYTLMLHATQPVVIYSGMLIGQVTFWTVKGEITKLYQGKYQGLRGPQSSQVHKDFS